MSTFNIHQEFSFAGQSVLKLDKAVINGGVAIYDEDTPLPANATTQVALAFPIANLKGLMISSEQTCTLKTNSSGSPADTLILTAGMPAIIWTNDMPTACPLGTAVTSLYFVVAAGVTTCKPKVYALYDAVP